MLLGGGRSIGEPKFDLDMEQPMIYQACLELFFLLLISGSAIHK